MPSPIKYIFFGTPRFAAIVLSGLLDTLPPLAVVVNPDRLAGRKKVLTPPAAKALLQEKGSEIELLQPEKLSEIATRLKALEPDLFVVAAYGKIIPQAILNIPRLGTIGVHPSLLPRYRGATPIQSAILAGEEVTGLTLYQMDSQVDHGPVLAAKEVAMDGMAYPELEEALARAGSELLKEVLPKMARGEIQAKPQNEALANLVGKFNTEDAFIPWPELEKAVQGDQAAAKNAWRKIRAFDPEPGAWTLKGEARIKILKASLENGTLTLKEIQRAGKTPERFSGKLP